MSVKSLKEIKMSELRTNLGFSENENLLCSVTNDFIAKNKYGEKFVVYKDSKILINCFSTYNDLYLQVFDESLMKFGEELRLDESYIDYSLFKRVLEFENIYNEYTSVIREINDSNRKLSNKIYITPGIIIGFITAIAFCVFTIVKTGITLFLLFAIGWFVFGFITTELLISVFLHDFISHKLDKRADELNLGIIAYYSDKIKRLS